MIKTKKIFINLVILLYIVIITPLYGEKITLWKCYAETKDNIIRVGFASTLFKASQRAGRACVEDNLECYVDKEKCHLVYININSDESKDYNKKMKILYDEEL